MNRRKRDTIDSYFFLFSQGYEIFIPGFRPRIISSFRAVYDATEFAGATES